MITQLTLHNIPRAYTAIAEWNSVVLFVILMNKRYSHQKTIGIMLAGLLGTLGIQLTAGTLPRFLWIPGMLVAIAFMIIMIYLNCDITLRFAVYQGIRAFILAEFAASLEWQLYYSFVWSLGRESWIWEILYLVIIYFLIYLSAYGLESKTIKPKSLVQISYKELTTAVAIGTGIFAFSNLSFINAATPFSSNRDVEIFNIRTLIDFSGYLLLFLYHTQLVDTFRRYETETMETMLHGQLLQYKLSRESIDLVNRKYHDLKHQIGVLRAETDDELRNAYLDQMAEEIKVYEAQYITGNKTLDTILTSQNLYCMKHSIEMVCVADGALLDFMEVMDICTIFGNALDNAVECELKIKDKAKRMINLKLFRQKQFMIISVMNYCEEQIVLDEGLPLTSKKDHAYHGFGVKSIQIAAQKYDGSISVGLDENWFKLLVMIPLK